jgi:hypothetical protein
MKDGGTETTTLAIIRDVAWTQMVVKKPLEDRPRINWRWTCLACSPNLIR